MKFDFDFPSTHDGEELGYQYVEAIIMVKFITPDGEIGWFRSRTDGVNVWEGIGVCRMVLAQDEAWVSFGGEEES